MDILVPTKEVENAAAIMTALNAGESWIGEFEVKRRDGTCFVAFVSDSPIFDDEGSLIGIVGVSHGLSEMRLGMERNLLERTAELENANDALQKLSARLRHLRDEQSRRIARELHDSVGQLVAAIGMNTHTIKAQAHKLDDAGAKAIAENQAMLKELSQEIRTISHLLHPPLLDELGLSSALHIFVDGYSARSSIDVKLEIPPDFGRISQDIEMACFRIVQECLTNVHRHSQSSAAIVTIGYEDSRISVEVRDNGKGIPPERLSQITSSNYSAGIGLAGIRERVKQLGGSFKIKSDGKGTSVAAILPVG